MQNDLYENKENQNILIKCRVLSQGKTIYKLEHDKSIIHGKLSGKLLYSIETKDEYPVVGDYVLVEKHTLNSEYGVISKVLPRTSLFKRRGSGSGDETQYIASNIDNVLICVDSSMKLNLRKIERYVSLSWESGATPIIVLTKIDLEDDIYSMFRAIESIAIGIEIFGVSVNESDEYLDLFEVLKPGTTSMLLGDSGVGKSSLINALTDKELMATKELNKHKKGKHTTTFRELIYLSNGSMIIDTPGLRELGMINAEKGIEETFSDIEELISKCKFKNCTHNDEPGCSVYSAIKEGELSNNRWLSYVKLKKENDYFLDRVDYITKKEVRFKEISKKQKTYYKKNHIKQYK
jgi:ribosome biogenesis GTPase